MDYTKHYRCARMIGIDPDYGMMRAYDSMGWPRFVLIDSKGIVRFHGFWSDRKATNLIERIEEVLSEELETNSMTSMDGLKIENDVVYPTSVLESRAAPRDRSPRLALDPQGNPWIVYASNRGGTGNIMVRHQGEGGQWIDEPLTTGRDDDYAPDCVFDSSGKLWITWCTDRSGRYDIAIAPFTSGEATSITLLTNSDDDAMRPRIAAGADGSLAVVYYKWRRMHGVSRDRDIFARRRDPALAEWGTEQAISPPEPAVEDHTDPDVVIAPDGTVWVVWSYDYHPSLFKQPLDTDQPSVFAARWPVGGAASEPFLAGTVGRRKGTVDLFPSVACDGNGTLWCVWDAYDWRGSTRAMRLVGWLGNRFSDAIDLTSTGVVASTPELATAADGGLLAAWTEQLEGTWIGRVIHFKPGSVVRQATLDAHPADVRYPQAAQAADGKIWVAYEVGDAQGSRVVVEEISSTFVEAVSK